MTFPHRLLTVRQPWATPIVDGVKTVENRGARFGLDFRGPLWIHAGARWDDDGLRSPLVADHYLHGTFFTNYRDAGFVLGAVIGIMIVVDAHHAAPGCCHGNPWAVTDDGTTHLVLAHPHKVRGPVVPGALGLWRPDRVDGLEAELDRLLDGLDRHPGYDDEFDLPVSIWPDLCGHPSATGGRCDACHAREDLVPC